MGAERLLRNGDYVSDGKGGWLTTSSLETKIQHQVLGEREAWWGDAEAGSNLHLLARAGNTERTSRAAAEATRVALRALEREGLARDIKVQVTRDQAGRLVIRASVTDAQTGQEVAADLLPFVG